MSMLYRGFKDFMGRTHIWVFLLPFLLFYSIVILCLSKGHLEGDEGRYLGFAQNLVHGFYSPPEQLNLWNGPGYPLVLMPFSFLGLPLLCFRLLNAIFLYLALVFSCKTLSFFVTDSQSKVATLFLALYPPFLMETPFVLTESFTVFLISIYSYCLVHFFRKQEHKKSEYFLPSFFLAFIALTKIIFGYVLIVGLFILFCFYLFSKNNKLIGSALSMHALALLFCLPYLFYTYSLTKNIFYWGNSGGSSLYWMSTPYADEFGDWHPDDLRGHPKLIQNHGVFFNEVSKLDPIEKDHALKSQAINNIQAHPLKYFKNWVANIGRMIFSYPYSYGRHDSIALFDFLYMVPNAFIFVLSVIFLLPSLRLMRTDHFHLILLLGQVILYLCASSLVSAYSRQFLVIVPILWCWMSYMWTRVMKGYSF